MILRRAAFTDWKLLLDWRNDFETRKNSLSMELVKEDDHKKWLRSKLQSKSTQLFIAVENNIPVGTVRADFVPSENAYNLSWTISPRHRNRGLGKKMVSRFVQQLDKKMRGEVKKENIYCIRIFEFIGMSLKKATGETLHFSNY